MEFLLFTLYIGGFDMCLKKINHVKLILHLANQNQYKSLSKRMSTREFPGDLVVKTLPSNEGDLEFNS